MKSRHYGLFAAALASSLLWGFSGHKLITEKAVLALPESKLKQFAFGNKEYLVQHCIDPDDRRGVDPGEGPQHYIDLELFGAADANSPLLKTGFDEPKPEPPSADPQAKPAKSKGRLPWRIEEVYTRLVLEMRTGAWEQARLTMAELAHYLEDSTVPLHATENYDGQMTGQAGAHARFEEDLVEFQHAALSSSLQSEAPVTALDAAGRKAAIWESLRTGFADMPVVLRADKEVILQHPEESWPAELWKRNGGIVQRRLARAVWMVASFWRSAWEEAGKPEPLMLGSSFVPPKDKIFPAADAKAHVGEEVTIEFTVVDVGQAKKTKNVYINSHDPHEGFFTAVVFSANVAKIEEALKMNLRDQLKGKKIRVWGKVQMYKDAPEIVITKPEQLEIVPGG